MIEIIDDLIVIDYKSWNIQTNFNTIVNDLLKEDILYSYFEHHFNYIKNI